MVGWRFRGDAVDAVTALALITVFTSGMVWFGTWLGMMVRSADAVMGIAFVVIFYLMVGKGA